MTLFRISPRRSAQPAKGYLRTRRPKEATPRNASPLGYFPSGKWMDALWYSDRNDLRDRFQQRFLHELN
jgi:hypothetical protein